MRSRGAATGAISNGTTVGRGDGARVYRSRPASAGSVPGRRRGGRLVSPLGSSGKTGRAAAVSRAPVRVEIRVVDVRSPPRTLHGNLLRIARRAAARLLRP